MLGPALSVVRALQQEIEQALVGFVGIIFPGGQEGVDLSRGWRQADQVVGCPPDEGQCAAPGGRLQSGLVEPGLDEAVDRISLARRRRGLFQRQEGPGVCGLVAAPGPVIGETATGPDEQAVLCTFPRTCG